MSPTEFSNYIKQRAMQQQQIHHGHGHSPNSAGGPAQPGNHFGPIGPVSPARSLSPNPLSLGLGQNGGDPFYFPSMAMGMYPQFNNHHRNLFDTTHFHGADSNGIFAPTNNGVGHGKFNNYLEPHGFYNMSGNHHMPHQQHQQQPQSPIAMNGGGGVGGAPAGGHHAVGNMKNSNENVTNSGKDSAGGNINATVNPNNNNNNNAANITVTVTNGSATDSTAVSPVPPTAAVVTASQQNTERQNTAVVAAANNSTTQDSSASSNAAANSKLIDGLNSFYSNATGSYQQLLVAN